MRAKELKQLSLYTIKINVFSIVAIALFAYSVYMLVDGIVIRHNLRNIQPSFDATNIKAGLFIETDLGQSDFMGNMGRNASGRPVFIPLAGENAATGAMSYIVAISKRKDYYITFKVSALQDREVRGYSYHLIGKTIKLEGGLPYANIRNVQERNEDIAKLIGGDSEEAINKHVSPAYALVIADVEKEKRRLYDGIGGIIFMLLLFFAVSIKRKLNDDGSLFDIPP
ncbi:MAG: hypothetical protein LBI54_01590 [Lachnospiraceae bacterium]|jgi:hypothetical protein|nr:hypothetical protein [Lachnospiraceae bacterium]